ncbi:MAG: LptF/LptG family permease [Phycisphaerae bacterium]|nr:LptF/LptG family permease [Gemmatimonadaceae bacterium]
MAPDSGAEPTDVSQVINVPVPAVPVSSSRRVSERAIRTRRPRRLITPLDRYVASEFARIFFVTLLGFPLLVIVIDLVEKLRRYTADKLTIGDVALSYYYMLPDTMFMVLPAATLFATVFSISAFTRYSEVTAAKASGISFYRFVAPVIFMSFMAMGLGLVVGEFAPPANAMREKILRKKSASAENERYNFSFSSATGRNYRIYTLNVGASFIERVEIEERRTDKRPGILIAADRGDWHAKRGWALQKGALHVIPTDTTDFVVAFDSIIDPNFRETAKELRASEKAPAEMTFGQLTQFIGALEASGADVAGLKVDRMLKLAIPVTCVIIALFGAPLATSSQRGGAAFGVAISLGTTIIFLILIQLTKAVGGNGVISPELAAWLPNILVGTIALILLARVRT